MRSITVVAVLAALAALAAAVPAARSARSTRTVTSVPVVFTDPTGDAGTAPDITSVKVSNDDKGQYTFDVAFATPYGDNAFFDIYLDTDMNASTGDPNGLGVEYHLYDSHAAHAFELEKWDGSTWVHDDAVSSVSVSIAADRLGLTMSINRSDLGNSDGFNFYTYSFDSADTSAGHLDEAPQDSWSYKLQPTLALSLGSATAGAAKAGSQWVVALVVKRSDTGATLGSEATLTCSGSSGAKKLVASTHAFVSGGAGKGSAAVCGFVLPKSLKHKAVSATMTVTYSGQTLTHTFTTNVR